MTIDDLYTPFYISISVDYLYKKGVDIKLIFLISNPANKKFF